MTNPIFDKTDKGRDEIATRKYHLAPRLRTMLLLFDGKSTTDQVLQKVAGLGLDMAGIAGLLEQEMIHEITVPAPPGTLSATPAVVPSTPAMVEAVKVPDVVAAAPSTSTVAIAPDIVLAPIAVPAQPVPTIDPQFRSIYDFFNDTIKKTIGLRGFALQLKVENARSIDDFRALRDSYVAAVKNAHGPEVARDLGDRLDGLLSMRP